MFFHHFRRGGLFFGRGKTGALLLTPCCVAIQVTTAQQAMKVAEAEALNKEDSGSQRPSNADETGSAAIIASRVFPPHNPSLCSVRRLFIHH